MNRTHGWAGFRSLHDHDCLTWTAAVLSPILRASSGAWSLLPPAVVQFQPAGSFSSAAAAHCTAADERVALFRRVNDALADPARKSCTNQLGIVKELLVQLALACLGIRVMVSGAAAAGAGMPTARSAVSDAATVRTMFFSLLVTGFKM